MSDGRDTMLVSILVLDIKCLPPKKAPTDAFLSDLRFAFECEPTLCLGLPEI